MKSFDFHWLEIFNLGGAPIDRDSFLILKKDEKNNTFYIAGINW